MVEYPHEDWCGDNLPPQQMMAGGLVSQTGFTGLTGLGGVGNLVNPVNPVQITPPQQTFASRWAANGCSQLSS